MLRKTLLSFCLCALSAMAFGQNNELKVEQLKYQIKSSGDRDGRSTALGLAVLGYDYLAPGNTELERMIYEVYYTTADYDTYDEGYTELTFNASDWSPDGATLAVAMGDGTIRLYNASDFKNYETIDINDGGVLDVSWSPNGSHLAYSGAGGEVGYLSTSTWEQEREWEEGDYVRAVAFSPDSKRIAAGGDENIVFVYNIQNGEKERAFESHTDWIRGVSWSADGTMVAAASDDNTATVWSITQGNLIKTHRDNGDYCRDLAFSPADNVLVTVSDDLNVFVYDPSIESVPSKNMKGHENWVMTVDWSSKGRFLATADNGGTIIVHTLKNGDQEYYNSVEPETAWMDIDFSSDDTRLAATSSYELAIYMVGESSPTLRLTPDGDSENVGAEGGEDQLEELLSKLLTGAVGLSPSTDGNRMAIINESYQLDVVDMETGTHAYTIDQHEDWIRNVSWSSDNRLIATASDDQMVGIWDAANGDMQQLLSGHTDWVRDVAFSPDDKVLASAGDDGVLRFWDPATGDELGSTESIGEGSYLMTVNWSPDGAYLAAESSDNLLYIWNANNNDLLFTSENYIVQGSANWVENKLLEVHDQEGQLLSWNGGDELVESTGGSGVEATNDNGMKANSIGTYIAISGSQKALLEGHNGTIIALEWSPDGKYLISQSTDGDVGLWEPVAGNLLAMLDVTDGLVKPLWWVSDGSGFYIPGAPGKVVLPTGNLRQNLADSDYQQAFSSDDIQRYEMEEIFLNDPAIVQKLKANASPDFLNAIADFYEQRSEAVAAAGLSSEDATKAAAFRTAAER